MLICGIAATIATCDKLAVSPQSKSRQQLLLQVLLLLQSEVGAGCNHHRRGRSASLGRRGRRPYIRTSVVGP
jgi:hypothetical protein